MITKNIIIMLIGFVGNLLTHLPQAVVDALGFLPGLETSFYQVVQVACYILPITACIPLIGFSIALTGYLLVRAMGRIFLEFIHLFPFI